ncbi:zinc finger C2HC domain-containing protein 1A-like [Drosophila hydei]|uniref:Zinc finger C2HC domain-containing protein 1A-like n=1 Tax=Drosophila hydei TaxID=7224 RepID=A0A6J1M508_DROHY|nr:zinc finger C2HC domain-containing protein 1A-like [Drosophila hydei]XP_023171930.2 zinc finger C2HC domain-containing protein 1A-like [Drosophila hydei]
MYFQNYHISMRSNRRDMASNPTGITCNSSELKACPHCNRTFNPSVLSKHVAICGRGLKKRQIFDSSLQRREGFKYFNMGTNNSFRPLNAECGVSCSHRIKKLSTLKTPSTDATKQQNVGGDVPNSRNVSLPPNTPASSSTLIRESMPSSHRGSITLERCPHCNRSFNQKAIDSHIAYCMEKTVVASFNYDSDDIQLAKKRTEARLNYKPPMPRIKHSSDR